MALLSGIINNAFWNCSQFIKKKKNHNQIDENSFSNINFTRGMSLIGLHLIDTKFISK